MILLSTPHAHTTYADGKSTAREMVLSAIEKGFYSLGFSEHGWQKGRDAEYNLTDKNEQTYIAEVKALREEFADKLKIVLGVERDVVSCADRRDYRYVIGSVHYYEQGEKWSWVDGKLETVRACLEELYDGDPLKMAASYYQSLADYICAYKPDIIGHFDLLRKLNEQSHMWDTASKPYLDIACAAMDKAREGCSVLEINTGGMARGYMSTPYPTPELLAYWRTLKGRVVVSSDCHNAAQLDYAYPLCYDMLRAAGYKTALAIDGGKDLFVEYDL